MNLNKLAAYFLPAFAMLAITGLTVFAGAFGTLEENLAFFSLCLVIIFPLTFIVQGISCAIHHYHILPAIGISLVAFIIVFFVVIPGNNYMYGVYYYLLFFAGFAITFMVRRMKKQ
ncbi:MAG: hypothetical protein KBT36_11870 [Kurthia sp.]|nr:hypothetical protein [Candidatus Kurthia equi]